MLKVRRVESEPEPPAVPGNAPAPSAFETVTPSAREIAVPLVLLRIWWVVPLVGTAVMPAEVAPSTSVSVAEWVKAGAVNESVDVLEVKPEKLGVIW
jgi:hypothetical protein